ncbi:MAG: cupin domain-containing protein [Chitinophagales bacterium]
MNTKELIESGLLELYCIGATTPEENTLVEIMVSEDANVKQEINAIQNALKKYSENFAMHPPSDLLGKILNNIAAQESEQHELPPLLSENSNTGEWFKYLKENNIVKPHNSLPLNMIEFVTASVLTAYVAWAEKGAFVEESHSTETEKLFMLQGSCKIEIDGITNYYNAGDFIEIAPGSTHRAEATSNELMILIGQRIAA